MLSNEMLEHVEALKAEMEEKKAETETTGNKVIFRLKTGDFTKELQVVYDGSTTVDYIYRETTKGNS